jgi:cytidine deaminase
MKTSKDTADQLVKKALEARNNAYAPYSGYRVGAALLAKSGKVYTGVNVENVAYGLTNCAERTAIFNAVTAGEREFLAVAVANDGGEPGFPCGSCRQVLYEFCSPDIDIITSNQKGEFSVYTLEELLPHAFYNSRITRKVDTEVD